MKTSLRNLVLSLMSALMLVVMVPAVTTAQDACIASPGYTSSSVTNGDGTVSITYTVQHAMEVTDFCQAAVLPQFDPALGTLQSATVTYGIAIVSQAELYNGAVQAQKFNWRSDIYMDIEGPSVLASLPVTLFNFVGQVEANASKDLGTVSPTDSGSTGVADLASYTGTGTLNYSAIVSSSTTSSGGGANVVASQSTTASTSVSVTYVYTPVVVPSPTPVTPPPATAEPTPTEPQTPTATATATATEPATTPTSTVVVADKLPETGSGMGTTPVIMIATIATMLAGAAGLIWRAQRGSTHRS